MTTDIDTSMYPKKPDASSNDPYHSLMQVMQMKNAMNSISKIKGGMPQTQDSLSLLGADSD